MPKKVAKQESSSEESSSEEDEEAKAKAKALAAKGKAKAKAKAPVSSSEEESSEESGSDSDSEEEKAPARKKKADLAALAAEPAKPKEPPKPFSMEFIPHTAWKPMEGPINVFYCPNCGLPPDFCIHGPTWGKCKPWAVENYPKYYPELAANIDLDAAKKDAAAVVEKSKEKMLPGGKKKREASPHIHIKKLSRGGRKCVTSVAGLETFGVKMEPLAKIFKKKFSCGCAVVKGDNGAPDTVDIQGDFEDEVVDLIMQEHKEILRSKFTINRDGGTKKKGKGK